MHLCLYISQSTFYPVSFQVYGHQRPDDGTAERFNKTRWRQWEKSCENAFEIAGGQKWGSTEPCCQMVRAWTVIAMFPGTNKAITDCRECVRAEPGPWHLPQTPFARDFALSCQALHFLCRHSQGVSVAARDYFVSTSVFLLQTLHMESTFLRFYSFREKHNLKFWSSSSWPLSGFEIQCWISPWFCLW